MCTNDDSHYNHSEHDTKSSDPPVVDQQPVNASINGPLSGDVVNEDEDTVVMNEFSVDEVKVKKSATAKLKQKLILTKQHAISSFRVLLSLLK